jgi:hypothetical protein
MAQYQIVTEEVQDLEQGLCSDIPPPVFELDQESAADAIKIRRLIQGEPLLFPALANGTANVGQIPHEDFVAWFHTAPLDVVVCVEFPIRNYYLG